MHGVQAIGMTTQRDIDTNGAVQHERKTCMLP